jgi:oxygen-dependent protoporphyrinogen oxidase
VRLPGSPPAAVSSRLLSARAKLRLCAEPLIAARRDDGDDESVAAFVRRRLGAEVLDYLVDPFVAGVCAGDPERLSARHVLRRAVELEREHGSLAAGVWRAARARRPAGTPPARGAMISFRRGLSTLPDAIAARLGAAVRLGERVVSVRRTPTGWDVRTSAHDDEHDVSAAAVLLAAPAHALSSIRLPAGLRDALAPVRTVEHAPVATLALGFRRADVAHALDGFGLLAPSAERRTILGALFNSATFADRAPDGHVLVTSFVGGVRRPELAAADPDALLPRVLTDLRELLGLSGAPTFVRHTQWPRAIPQYALGHDAVAAAAQRAERESPGFFVAGQYLDGAALGDCIASGQAAAGRTAAWLASRPAPHETTRPGVERSRPSAVGPRLSALGSRV